MASRSFGLGYDPASNFLSKSDSRAVLRDTSVPARARSRRSTFRSNSVPPSRSRSTGSTRRRGKKPEQEPSQNLEVAPPRKSKPNAAEWDTTSSICTLNVFCRRTSQGRYVGHRITVIDVRAYLDPDEARAIIMNDPHLVHNDRRFFEELNFVYYTHMCSFWRRWFSLKTLRTFQLVKVRSIIHLAVLTLKMV